MREPVVRQQHVVGEGDAVPAPDPFVVQRELTVGVDAAAELTITRLAGEGTGIKLVDAVGADLIRPVDQALAEFGLEQHALARRDARIDGHVVVGRNRPVERDLNGVSVA